MRGLRRKIGTLTIGCITAMIAQQAKAIEYGNIQVVQNDALNNASSVTITTPQATAGFSVPTGNRGDYDVTIGASNADDVAGGILITAVSQNGRNNNAFGDTTGFTMATSAVEVSGGRYFIPVHASQQGTEFNINVAAAYFPYADGWTGGISRVATNGGAITSLLSSPNLNLGTEFVDLGGGRANLFLPGVDARVDGIVLVNGGKNEDNFALSRPSADGTSFQLAIKDNGSNGSGLEQDPVAFVYIPKNTQGLVLGRVSGGGNPTTSAGGGSGAILSQGDFTIQTLGVGRYQLDIAGQTSTSGVLLISPEGMDNLNVDNIVTYQANGTGWEIQTRDLTGTASDVPGLQTITNPEAAFNFVFLPFVGAPTNPGAALPAFNPTAVAAGNVKVTEFSSGNNPGDNFALVVEGSRGLGTSASNRGDNTMSWLGTSMKSADGVLLATAREDFRNNSATGGVSGIGMHTPWVSGGEYLVATHALDGSNPGEMNANFAVAFFPNASGFLTGHDIPTSGGTATLSLSGVSSATDGLLFVNAFGNDDNFATANPNGAGGWTVQVRDNSGGLEGDSYSYVFIPRSTPNMIMGAVSNGGIILDSVGAFTLQRSALGEYVLNVFGESPLTGMLLLTANHGDIPAGGNSSDNYLTYFADGDSFVIRGYDANGSQGARQDTDFSFAFIRFGAAPQATNNNAIPEPASLLMLGLAAMVLATRRRKQA